MVATHPENLLFFIARIEIGHFARVQKVADILKKGFFLNLRVAEEENAVTGKGY